MKRRLLMAAAAAATLPPAWSQGAPARAARPGLPARLVFGLITPRNADQMLRNWNPFFDRMAAALGTPVERQTFPNGGELVREFQAGRLDLAWLGNAPALELVESGHGTVFAAMVVQGKTAYRSVLITHRDSPLRNLDDVHRHMRELTFGDGDRKSTSGHLVPKYFAFAKRGVNEPDQLFRQVRRGSHEANLLAAARKEVDLATNNTTELDNFRSSYPQEAALLRVLWESPDIPESPMVCRGDLPAAARQKIGAFVYGFGTHDPEEKNILWQINKVTAWRKSSNRQLLPVADLEMFNARQRIMNDPSLGAEERLRQVDDVTRRGSRLELMLRTSSMAGA
jgi:phosphonate transport system substrate-binding protein